MSGQKQDEKGKNKKQKKKKKKKGERVENTGKKENQGKTLKKNTGK